MRRLRRIAFVLPTVVAGLVLLAMPGAAQASGRISQIHQVSGGVQFVYSPETLGRAPDPGTVSVRFNGRTVAAEAHLLGSKAVPAEQRSVVLLIDASASMQGAGIAGAKQAAIDLLRAVPAGVRVGLVSFSHQPHPLIAPTLDRGLVAAAVSRLSTSTGTSLYDAIGVAIHELGPVGDRHIVLLSDGGNNTGKTTLADATAELRHAHVVLDAVGFRTPDTQNQVLTKLADAGSGRVVTANGAATLASAFRAAANELSEDLVVTVPVPSALAGRSVTMWVGVQSAGRLVSDEVRAQLPGSPEPLAAKAAASGGGSHGQTLMLVLGLGALFLGMFAIVALLLPGLTFRRNDGSRVADVISEYTQRAGSQQAKPDEPSTALGNGRVVRSVVGWAGRVTNRGGLDERLTLKLDSAGIPMKPAEWLVVHLLAGLVVGMIVIVLSRSVVIGVFAGLLLGAIGPAIWLHIKARRRQTAFEQQLPDSLQLIASGLSAGYSLLQSLDSVVREGQAPISTEVSRALAESRLGLPIEDALDAVATRMDNIDLHWTTMAIRVQRQVGGNLAEVLTRVSQTMRERARFRRHVRSLSAEGRLSAYILIGIPIALAAFTLTFRRGYEHPLYTEPIGIAMSVFAILFMIIGSLMMRKLVKVEV